MPRWLIHDNSVVAVQGRWVGTKFEGVPGLDRQGGAGELLEPVSGNQRGVPGGADTDQMDPLLPGQFGCDGLHLAGVLAQHFLHGLWLPHDGVVHEVGVAQAYFLLCHLLSSTLGPRGYILKRPGQTVKSWGHPKNPPRSGGARRLSWYNSAKFPHTHRQAGRDPD